MIPYQTKSNKLAGTDYKEVYKNAMFIFRKIESATKRKPYVRSAYFRENKKKQKIFFDYFWVHLSQKGPKERVKRLQYFKELFYAQVKENKKTKQKYLMSCFPLE